MSCANILVNYLETKETASQSKLVNVGGAEKVTATSSNRRFDVTRNFNTECHSVTSQMSSKKFSK